MQKTIFLAGLLLLSCSLFGQSTFHKKFQRGAFFSITPLSGGGYLGSGYQDQQQFFEPAHGLLARFNNDGELVWHKRYPALNFIRYSVETDNGFLMIGDSISSVGPLPRPRYSIISRLSDIGTVVWSRIIENSLMAAFPTQVMDVPSGYIISGGGSGTYTTGGNAIARIDENGDFLWSKVYSSNAPNFHGGFSVQLIQGDTLYACGHLQGNGCFIRINHNTGELIGWSSFGGIYREGFSTIKATQDGNFMLAGLTRSTTGSEEERPWVVKIDRIGQIIWSKTYNISGVSLGCHMAETDEGDFVLSMGQEEGLSNFYSVIAKIDQSGNLLWAYNYSDGQSSGLDEIKRTSDGGFVVLDAGVLKIDKHGRVANGCCPAPVTFQVADFMPPYQNVVMIAEDWEVASPFFMQAVPDEEFKVNDFCETPITSIVEQIQVCQGDSIQINGSFFQAPNTVRDTVLSLTGGCDTVRVYNLIQIPQPFRVETISFCPGDSVIVNGTTYTQPGIISQILPATVGCDTLLTTFLQFNPFPRKYETTTFCPGDTVIINGVSYQFPGILPNPDTIPGTLNDCDTLLYQVLAYPSTPSAVSVNCPPNIELSTDPATPVVVSYTLPTAMSDCVCPEMYISLFQGFSSGEAFPVGNTQVCYSASDICGNYKTCCFEVNVLEEEACDIKESGCVQYELLGISADAEQNKTYRVRVTNNCASRLIYAAFQIPNGLEALSPLQASTYLSFNGREYTVRNPNHSPFRSVRFKPIINGISGGGSDIFEYTLPAQSSPTFIRATTRLASGAFYEVMLNTFGCSIQAERPIDRTGQSSIVQSLRVFPNPNSGELFIDFSGWGSGSAQLRILNAPGQELAKILLPTTSGVQPVSLPITLMNGLYLLEITSESGERQVTKFMLRR